MSRRRVLVGALVCIAALGAGVATWSLWPEPPPLVVLAEPVPPSAPARADLPDVVVVIGCTLRKDQLSVYGGAPGTTPYLESLAREGALFTDAIASAPWTKAANTAILTGWDPVSIGMADPGKGRDNRKLPAEVTTLAEHLGRAGYHTVGATANPNLNGVFGFAQGFDAYIQLERLWREDMVKIRAEHLLPRIEDALDDAPDDRPLYLQVLLVDAHAPFEETGNDPAEFGVPPPPPEVAGEVTAYRAAIRDFDAAVEALVETLEARGHTAEDTLLVVLSDHGEGLSWPDHHGKAHGRFLAPSTVGALWLARGPGVGAGVRVDGLSSQVDVVPTVLGALALDGYRGPGLDHSGLLAAGGRSARTRAWTDTWFIDTNRAAVYTDDEACQRDFSGAVAVGTRRAFREGCFDRRGDPLHEKPRPHGELEQELVAWRAERTVELEAAEVEEVDLDDDVAAQLEALGYTDR